MVSSPLATMGEKNPIFVPKTKKKNREWNRGKDMEIGCDLWYTLDVVSKKDGFLISEK